MQVSAGGTWASMDKDGDQTGLPSARPLWLVRLWLSAKPSMLIASLCLSHNKTTLDNLDAISMPIL